MSMEVLVAGCQTHHGQKMLFRCYCDAFLSVYHSTTWRRILNYFSANLNLLNQ